MRFINVLLTYLLTYSPATPTDPNTNSSLTAGFFTYTRLLTVTTNPVSGLLFYHPFSHC